MASKKQSTSTETKEAGVLFKFKDRGEILVKDKKVLEKLLFVCKAIERNYPQWRKDGEHFEATVNVPFPKSTGQFIFANVKNYVSPTDRRSARSNVQKHYPQTLALDLEAMRDVIEGANYLESSSFVESMGFVIADRLKKLDIEQIVTFLGMDDSVEPAASPSTSKTESSH